MKNSVLNLRPASAFTGTVISDIDLREPIPDSAVAEMKNALFETGVLFFRSQNLEPAHQMALAEKFGPVPDAE
ncbi:MAG: TauD/TfdA family dioxygenase, partial [Rhodospirillales bacterium]|nr:TauD/TfdA family dioxygenase [Rhodospirillales bacterium]